MSFIIVLHDYKDLSTLLLSINQRLLKYKFIAYMTIENFTILFSKYIEFTVRMVIYSAQFIICCHCWYMLAPPRCWA